MKLKRTILILILLLVFIGPYVFVYSRTATWTFPRIDDRDFKAIESLEPLVKSQIEFINVQNVKGVQEATYLVNAGILHRKFLDWIGFPLVVEVNNFTFKGIGTYQNKLVFVCNHFETAFPKPTGKEPWYLYQPLVDKNDNTFLKILCYGDASAINTTNILDGFNLVWSMSATFIGDRNDKTRIWNSSQLVQVNNSHA
jgi:hypothetical protein